MAISFEQLNLIEWMYPPRKQSSCCGHNTFFKHEMFFICLVRSSEFATKTVTGQTFHYI